MDSFLLLRVAGGTGVLPVPGQDKACGYQDTFMVLGVPLEPKWLVPKLCLGTRREPEENQKKVLVLTDH